MTESIEHASIPDWKLERYLLGELPASEMARIDHLRGLHADLNARLTALSDDNAKILARFPFRGMQEATKATKPSTPRPRNRELRVPLWGKVAAAVALLLIAFPFVFVKFKEIDRLSMTKNATLSTGRIDEMGLNLQAGDDGRNQLGTTLLTDPAAPSSQRPATDTLTGSLAVSEKTTGERFEGNGFTPEGPAGGQPNVPPGYSDKDYETTTHTRKAVGSPRVSGKAKPQAPKVDGSLLANQSFQQKFYNAGKEKGRRVTRAALKAGVKADRLLAYQVSMTIETNNLADANLGLLEIVSKYGFLKQLDYIEEHVISGQLRIRASQLYKALAALSKLGKIKSERIYVEDLTRQMFKEQVHAERDAKRVRRKRRSLAGSPARKNWVQRQEALEESEDREDASRIARWQIRDRVKWAEVSLVLQLPEKPAWVAIPKFQNILVHMTSAVLVILYYVAYALPLVLIVWLLWYKRTTLGRLFRRG